MMQQESTNENGNNKRVQTAEKIDKAHMSVSEKNREAGQNGRKDY